MKKVLVTGATGAIGPVLVKLLVSKGYSVRIMTRNQEKALPELGRAECHIGDLTHMESVEKAVSDIDIVFHLAALLHQNNPDKKLEKEYYKVNVEGTDNLLKASCRSGVKRFIFFSTISVYPSGNPSSLIAEKDMVNPRTYYEKTKYQAEQLINNFYSENKGPEITILRFASVYGSRIKGNYKTMIKAISKGFFICPGRGLNKRTLIHEKDAARAALIASKHPGAAGKVFNVTDGSVHTMQDIVNSIASGLERKVIAIYLPSAPFERFVDVSNKCGLSRIFGFRYLTEMIAKINENMPVSGEKIIKELGFQPEWDLASGMKDVMKIN